MYVVSYICPACETTHDLLFSNNPYDAERSLETFTHTSHPFCRCGRINDPFNLIIVKRDGLVIAFEMAECAPIIEVA